jgi:hypothetical protein
MPTYMLRFEADSLARLSTKAYIDDASARHLTIGLGEVKTASFDRPMAVRNDLLVPQGLLVQIELDANNLDNALDMGQYVATQLLSIISAVSFCSIGRPWVIWAYDSTPRVVEREYRQYVYDILPYRPTRQLNDQHLFQVLEKDFGTFLQDQNVKDDYKNLVQRALVSYRRGLADNDDVLTEFLIAWSTMEGLDCVYCQRLPSASVRDFKDGMKDVFRRLGEEARFDTLETLRNRIAHGFLKMDEAIHTASANIDLARKALVLMILRILKVEEATCNAIVSQMAYKGTFRTQARLYARIDFDPGDVKKLAGHPEIATSLADPQYTKAADRLMVQPNVNFRPINLRSCRPEKHELLAEPGTPMQIDGVDTRILRQD